ncbi:TolC family protein [bacterium]|nr:TolC family protein [bacterium]
MSFYIVLITFINVFSYNLSSSDEKLVNCYIQKENNWIVEFKKEIKKTVSKTPSFKNPEFSASIEAPFQLSKEQRVKLASFLFSIPISDKNHYENEKNLLEGKIALFQIESYLSEITKNLLLNIESSRFLTKKYEIYLFYSKQIEQLINISEKNITPLELKILKRGLFKIESEKTRVLSQLKTIYKNFSRVCSIDNSDSKYQKDDTYLSNLLKNRETIIVSTIENSSEIKIANIDISSDKQSVKYEKESAIPDIGVETSLIRFNEESKKAYYGFEFGLSIEIPIFDSKNREISIAKQRVKRKKIALESKTSILKTDLQNRYDHIETIFQEIQSQTEENISLKNREILQQLLNIYKEGDISVGDLVDSIMDSKESEIFIEELYFELHNSIIEFESIGNFIMNSNIYNILERFLKN